MISSFIPVKGFPDYYINQCGHIISGKYKELAVLNQPIGHNGYRQVFICQGSTVKNKRIARLVMENFSSDWDSSLTVNHKDGNKLNNHLSNLEMVTMKQNTQHAWETGLSISRKGEACSSSKLDAKSVLFIRTYSGNLNKKTLARFFNISQSTICDINKYRSWGCL